MNNLISRKDVLEKLKYEMKYGAIIDQCGLEIAYDIVEVFPPIEPEQEWIPVTEALPEEETDVLVSVHFDGYKNSTYADMSPCDCVEVASYIDGCWKSVSDEYKVGGGNYHHVVAWMPLPKPIKMNNE